MDVTHGMDPSAIEALGHRLQDHYAARVQDVATQLNSLIAQTSPQWVGPKGDLFRSWWPAKRAKLIAIAQDLHGFGQSALNDAGEQRETSRAGNASRTTPAPIVVNPGQTWNHVGTIGEITGWAGRGSDLHTIYKDYEVLSSARGWTRAGPDVSVLGAVNTSIDVGKLLREINNGSIDGAIRSGIDVGFGVGGMVYSPIGLGKTAWDIGWWTGARLEESFDAQFGSRAAAFDSILYSRYGTTNLTTQQAHEMAHRYDGVSGFARWGGDTVASWFKGW